MKIVIVALLLSLTSACSIYRLGSRQGNEVTTEKVAELDGASTREQVLDIMGSPLIRDPFRDNRWDYVYYYTKQGSDTALRRVTVFFNGELVDRIEKVGLEESVAEESSEANSDDEPPSNATPADSTDTGAQGSDNI